MNLDLMDQLHTSTKV